MKILNAVVTLLLLLVTDAQRGDINIRVRVPVAGVDFLVVEWVFPPGQFVEEIDRAFITATYIGPCPGAGEVPPVHAELERPPESQHVVEGLQPYSSYSINVTVQTVNADGTGFNSARTRGSSPSSLTNVTLVSTTSTTITVRWEEIPCRQLNSRLEEYSLTFTVLNNPQNMTSFTAPAVSTVFTATGLARGTEYAVSLSALYTINDVTGPILEAIAVSINASTFSIPGPHTLVVTAQVSTIALSWQQEQPTSDLSGYDIQARYEGPCSLADQSPLVASVPISAREYIFSGLAAFGMYVVNISVVSSSNQRASLSRTVLTLPAAPSSAPQFVRVITVEAFSLTLAWDPLRCPERRSEIASYTVYYGPSPQYSESNRFSLGNVTDTTVRIVDVTPLTPYAIQVVAVNEQGLLGPLSPRVTTTTATPPLAPDNLRVVSTTSQSASLSWTPLPGFSYSVVATYAGPCPDVQLPPRMLTVPPEAGGSVNVTGLEEFSAYSVEVTPVGGRESSTVDISTMAADPSPADDHVQVLSSTFTSIVLQAPQIDCLDENGHISEFRIRYASSQDFQDGVNLKNGLFTPGLVIVGNLLSGTEYVFQLTILTEEGGSVTLEPVVARTRGFAPLSTRAPSTATTPPSPGAGIGPSTDAIITTVILVGGVIGLIVITTTVLICLAQRRGSGQKRSGNGQKRSGSGQKRSGSGQKRRGSGRKLQRQRSDRNQLVENENRLRESDSFEEQSSLPELEAFSPTSIQFNKFDWMSSALTSNNPMYQEEDYDDDFADVEMEMEAYTADS